MFPLKIAKSIAIFHFGTIFEFADFKDFTKEFKAKIQYSTSAFEPSSIFFKFSISFVFLYLPSFNLVSNRKRMSASEPLKRNVH